MSKTSKKQKTQKTYSQRNKEMRESIEETSKYAPNSARAQRSQILSSKTKQLDLTGKDAHVNAGDVEIEGIDVPPMSNKTYNRADRKEKVLMTKKQNLLSQARSEILKKQNREKYDYKRANKVLQSEGVSNKGYSEGTPAHEKAREGELVIASEAILEPETPQMTESMLNTLLPKRATLAVRERFADMINHAVNATDEYLSGYLMENIVGLLDCLKEGNKVDYKGYVNAARYLTYRQAGYSMVKSYSLTFPARVLRLEEDGYTRDYLATVASVYNRNKLVVAMQAQMLVPTHVMYQDVYHQAIVTQSELMLDKSVSPKVRSDAANSLMTHLKTPEVKQHEVSIKTNESNVLEQFKDAMAMMASQQKTLIDKGQATVVDVANQTIYEQEENLNLE